MKINKFYRTKPIIRLALLFYFIYVQNSSAQTICIQDGSNQKKGIKNGYSYELWNQNSRGTACMSLESGALFSGEWSGVDNYLARRGLTYNQTQKHQEIGVFYATFNCDYSPSPSSKGNSYLSIYGWTVNPLVEYYIIEDWQNWIPSMAANTSLKGSFTTNGSIYDVYEKTRVNKPSIVGNTTFQQYFSIRRNQRKNGTINISEHFKKWKTLGMNMGSIHEVSMVVEGYKRSGNKFTLLELAI